MELYATVKSVVTGKFLLLNAFVIKEKKRKIK